MSETLQKSKADLFRQLHHGPDILILPNAWDVASARVLEEAGYSAIATTSAGIAASLGYPDGEYITRKEMLLVVERIAKAVALPVTADMEAGYGQTPEEMQQTTAVVLATGAVGLNIQDGFGTPTQTLVDLSLQVEKLRSIRETAASIGIPLFINARTDAYLVGAPNGAHCFAEAVLRASAYREAGADCIFVPGPVSRLVIANLIAELKCPLNILAGPETPSIPELRNLGVARVSFGSGPMRASLGVLERLTHELQEIGTYRSLQTTISYETLNLLFQRAPGIAKS